MSLPQEYFKEIPLTFKLHMLVLHHYLKLTMIITKTPTRSYDYYPDYDSSCSSSIATTIPDSTRTSFSLASSNSLDVAHSNNQHTTTHHNKPHKANQAGWEAMKHLRSSQKGGRLGLEHFKLVHRVGSGDIGSVYLCQLRNYSPQSGGYYAMKVVDREALVIRNKLQRAEMEKEILGMLDHPFLPTLYAEFDTSHYSCLVMEYCPGGDLHAARQRQPAKRFTISSSKFYAAEALLALEYLHMMGIVYRDLKPENVLIREDGHIMLSDFDLSLKCDVVPKLLRNQTKTCRRNHPFDDEAAREEKTLTSCYTMIPSCATPMQPVLSCFFLTPSSKRKKNNPTTRTITTHVDNPNGNHYYHHEDHQELDPELVAEPVNARSKSFVGTHEYLAPEVISGQGHGGAVDWWTLGIFLYEMIYGRTPFKGDNNEKTLMNILKQPLSFPRINFSSQKEYEETVKVQDLISKLLVKNPKKRIGSLKGSVEIKRHEFFKGVNWALIRSVKPPENPKENHHSPHKIRSSSSSRGLMIVPKLTKKEREAPYQIPRHHFDFF